VQQKKRLEHEDTESPGNELENIPTGSPSKSPELYGKGMRVIQPLPSASGSQSSNIAVPSSSSSEPPEAPSAKADPIIPTPPVTAAVPLAAPRVNTSSIYPDPEQRKIAMATATPETTGHSKLMTRIIVLFGAAMLVIAGLSMLGWFYAVDNTKYITGGHFTPASVTAVVLAGCCGLLGMGIIMRRDIARQLYLLLAVILLGLTVYNTYTYSRDAHTYNLLSKRSTAYTEQQINIYQNDHTLPAAQKTALIARLHDLLSLEKSAISQHKKVLLPITAAYVITVAPLVFLLLPQVKKEFI